jgi:hypothetical protein
MCDPSTGICSNPLAPNGTACNDTDVCTIGDSCQGGSCQPGSCTACSGKFTGGGQVAALTAGTGTFGFNARNTGAGTASGHFNWVNHLSGCHIEGPVSTLSVCGNTATFSGTCSGNTVCTSFTVKVTDKGEPGAGKDTINITIAGACAGTAPGEQPIMNGNIQSH